MGKSFDLLVFDWDGTLLDSTAAIVASIQAACRDLGLPEPSDERASHVIGLGLADALRYSVPALSADRFPQMIERYRYHYLSRDHELDFFDGVAELIADLHGNGFVLGIATGKSRVGLERALDHSGLRPLFHASRCADECHSKPHPQMLEELLSEFAVAQDRALMIGDTTHDLQMAVNAGVSAIAVDYGAHSAEALDAMNPLARLQSVKELAHWLNMHA